jgi:hypothetical protein
MAKLDADGDLLWVQTFGDQDDNNGDRAAWVALHPSGNIVVGGRVTAGVDLGGGVLANHGWGDLFVAMFTPDGEHLWSRAHGRAWDDEVMGGAVWPDGRIAIAAHLAGTSPCTWELTFVLDETGGDLCHLLVPQANFLYDAVALPSAAAIVGSFEDTLMLGPAEVSGPPGRELFVGEISVP